MKTLPAGLQDLLDSGATTLVYCWRITRKDELVQGFTEHDNDLEFDGTTFLASSGFSATRIQQSLGLSVDNLEVQGALSSDTLNEQDLAVGLYDDATVELFWVNFEDVDQRVLISKGSIGEVKRQETAFTAEFRSLAHKLNQATGRTYQRYCDATVGDTRCGVNINNETYRGEGEVTSVSGRILTHSGLEAYEAAWFTHGILTFTSGDNDGLSFEVKRHSTTQVELWREPALPVLVTDTFRITAGCKKDNITCRTKFDNLINFQGFPFMPGNDVIQQHPKQGEGGMNGGSLGLGRE